MSATALRRIVTMAAAYATWAAPAWAQATGAPKLVLSAESWNFGTVQHPKKVDYTLTVSNKGTAELRLTQLATNCGCTVAKAGKDALAPGESTEIKITYDTKDRAGPTGSAVTITTNDPVRPQVVFEITGFVKRAVTMDPPSGVAFQMLDPNRPYTRTVKLLNQEKQPIHPVLGSFPTGKFSAELREIKPGQEYEVLVTTRPPFSRVPVQDQMEIATGLESEPKITLAAKGQVVGRVELYPAAVYIPPDSTQPTRRAMVVQYFGDDLQFRVIGATCDDPNIKLSLTEPGITKDKSPDHLWPNVLWRVMIELPPADQLPATGRQALVTTNDPEYPELLFLITKDMGQYQAAVRQAEMTSQQKPAH